MTKKEKKKKRRVKYKNLKTLRTKGAKFGNIKTIFDNLLKVLFWWQEKKTIVDTSLTTTIKLFHTSQIWCIYKYVFPEVH